MTPILTESQKPTRREHIVPRLLLANFTDPNGVLWVYAKGKPVRSSIPTNECWERDFYEYELNDRKTNNKYENWLARVEDDAAKVLQILARRESLGQSGEVIWATFVASLFVRTRKVRMQISAAMIRKFEQKTKEPDFIRTLQYEFLQRGEFHYADDLRKSVEKTRKAMDESPSFYHVSGLPRHTLSLADALMRKKWNTVDAPPGKIFLLSDCPVMTAELDGSRVLPGAGFGKENTAVLVPITSGKLFIASPHDRTCLKIATPRGVDMINLQAVQFGHRNVYTNVNSPDIQLLVDTEINRIVFGKNAFLPGSQSSDG
jgi:hypothetical protein